MREALWLLALLLAAYATFEFLRALRLPRAQRTDAPPARAARLGAGASAPPDAAGAEDEGDDDEDGLRAYAPVPAATPAAAASAAPATQAILPPPPDQAAQRFELELENSRLRQALQVQRDLVALQQGEIDRLVEDLTALRDQVERQGPVAESSPEYAEALVLARQGLAAGMIAERCDISLAEADLVLALARREDGLR